MPICSWKDCTYGVNGGRFGGPADDVDKHEQEVHGKQSHRPKQGAGRRLTDIPKLDTEAMTALVQENIYRSYQRNKAKLILIKDRQNWSAQAKRRAGIK